MNVGDTTGFKLEVYLVYDEKLDCYRDYGVKVTHIQTGKTESCDETTSLLKNKEIAMRRLYERLMSPKPEGNVVYSLQKEKRE